MNNSVCFIPIKKRSTRVPSKNLRRLNGKPLFKYIVDVAKQSEAFDDIYIDTDSEEIKEYCIKNNLNIIDRDPALAEDSANGNDLLNHWYEMYPDYDYYFQLFATSPFTKSKTIKDCIRILHTDDSIDSIFTANENCGWYWFNGKPINYNPKILPRSQDAKKVFNETTALYGIKKSVLKKHKCRIGDNPYFYMVGDIEATDIDSEFDFMVADMIAKEGWSE